jgi:hypothetical protein
MLEKTGLTKDEADSLFKEVKIANNKQINTITKIQMQIDKMQQQYEQVKWKALANPLNVKNILILYFTFYKELEAQFLKLKEEFKLNKMLIKDFEDVIKEIDEIISKNVKNLEEKIDKDSDFYALKEAKEGLDKLNEKMGELKEKVFEKDFEENLKGLEVQVNEKNLEAKNDNKANDILKNDEEFEPKKISNLNKSELDVNLNDCYEAISGELINKKRAFTEKEIAFFVLSEYIHAYNNANKKDVFEKFKDILTKDEFVSVYVVNAAIMNSDLDYKELAKKMEDEAFDAVTKVAKSLINSFTEYKELAEKVRSEIESDFAIDIKRNDNNNKKLEFKNIDKNKNVKLISM